MKYRAQSGEVVNGNSWVLRNIWDTKKGYRRGQISEPAKLKASGVKRLMEDALWTQGLRTKLEPGKRRHEFQTDHGFRKWFKTRCEIAGMKPINIEKLMGHSTGISDSYYRATETELLTDYQNAIEVLTIDNENRLKTELRQLKNEVTTSGNSLMSKLEERNTEINAMQQEDLINKDAIRALSDRITLLIEELERIKSRA